MGRVRQPAREHRHGNTGTGNSVTNPLIKWAYVTPHLRHRSPASSLPGNGWNPVIDFPDVTLRREQDLLREKLDEVQLGYMQNKSQENRAEYKRVLGIFADLVMTDAGSSCQFATRA